MDDVRVAGRALLTGVELLGEPVGPFDRSRVLVGVVPAENSATICSNSSSGLGVDLMVPGYRRLSRRHR